MNEKPSRLGRGLAALIGDMATMEGARLADSGAGRRLPVDFLIANRPGIRAEALRLVIPPDLLAGPHSRKDEDVPAPQIVAKLHRTSVYMLENVASDVSATDIRKKAQRGQSIHGLVSARVEEYILKQGLYR